MPDRKFTPRRNLLKIATSTGLAALGGYAFAQALPFAPKKFEWLPTECADERYPMQLITGDMYYSSSVIAAVPSGKIVNNGWGAVGSRRLIGTPQKPVPDSLQLSWFSYTENQFFAGAVALPHAVLKQLFLDGFEEPLTGARVTWSKIIVGMGLGGWTSVWLAGSGLVHEVARIQLKPTQLDWALVLDNPAIERSTFIRSKLQARLSESVLDALAKHGPPVSAWPRYAQRCRWRIDVTGIHVPLHMFLRSFNGERQFYDFARPPPEAPEAAPKHVQITWLSRSGRKLLSEIYLDESEVFGSLDQVRAAASDTPAMTLWVDLGTGSRVSIALGNQANRIPLTRSRIEVSSLGA